MRAAISPTVGDVDFSAERWTGVLAPLNDPAYFEFAKALAARVLREAPSDDEGRLNHAFRLTVARKPGEGEMRRLHALLEDARGADPELEAWTSVARVLLNLDEFMTRE